MGEGNSLGQLCKFCLLQYSRSLRSEGNRGLRPAAALPALPTALDLSHTGGDLIERFRLRVQALSTLTPKHPRAPEQGPQWPRQPRGEWTPEANSEPCGRLGAPWGTVWVGDGEQTQGEDVGLAQRGLPMGTVTAEGGRSPGGAV